MQQSMVSGLIIATAISLGISLSALAEDTMKTQTNSVTRTSQYSSEQTQGPVVAQPGLSNLALSKQFGYTQDAIIIGSSDGSSPMFLPKLTIGEGNTSILALNPTPRPVSLSIPQLNSTMVIPPNGARVIQLDKSQTASLTPGQEVAYYINDADGNQIASSNFVNTQEIVSMIDINTQIASSTEETRTPIRKPTERKSTVRGYW
ncbi:hypothetical protein [Vampirovibrio chlorellavorus]|uniref:hypothetical protein n=1 Tax=Vampirovibrio chlorellavorus TaxID=758823 RepID=UPI0026F32474|nr:hypothetical protein [Vampirovibrio chlorellavorus]